MDNCTVFGPSAPPPTNKLRNTWEREVANKWWWFFFLRGGNLEEVGEKQSCGCASSKLQKKCEIMKREEHKHSSKRHNIYYKEQQQKNAKSVQYILMDLGSKCWGEEYFNIFLFWDMCAIFSLLIWQSNPHSNWGKIFCCCVGGNELLQIVVFTDKPKNFLITFNRSWHVSKETLHISCKQQHKCLHDCVLSHTFVLHMNFHNEVLCISTQK